MNRPARCTALAVTLWVAAGCQMIDRATEPAGPIEAGFTESTPASIALTALREQRDEVLRQPVSGTAWQRLAQSLLDPDLPTDQRHPIEAVRAAHRALEYGAPECSALITLGTAYYISGNIQGALDAYERALEADADERCTLESRSELQEFLVELRAEHRQRN